MTGICMAGETEDNGIIKSIRSALCLLDDVVDVNVSSAKLAAQAAAPFRSY